jgi:hypothetical protein
MELIRFLESEPEHAQQLAALDHPIQEIEHVLGVDRSQTHFCAKPDGIVMMKFNKGPTFKSTTNDKTRARFIIPHDVVLSEGDINLAPFVAPAPVLPSAEDVGDDSDSDDEIPLAQMLERDAPSEDEENSDDGDGDEPPLGAAAVNEEVAHDFGDGHGVHVGCITGYDGDFYSVTYDDGDFQDFTTEECVKAWKHAKKIDDRRSSGKKKKKKKKKKKPKARAAIIRPVAIAIVTPAPPALRKSSNPNQRRPRRNRRPPSPLHQFQWSNRRVTRLVVSIPSNSPTNRTRGSSRWRKT